MSPKHFPKRKIKRVPINNALRRIIKAYLASKNLNHEDSDRRKSAASKLLAGMSDETVSLFKERLLIEEHPDVKQLLETGIALDTLNNGESAEQLLAIETLSTSLEPTARNALQEFSNHENAALAQAAQKGLVEIESKIEFYGFIEKVFFGLSLGSVLVLAAIGLAITFGVMGCINMAHGELIMIGAYTTYVIQLLMPNSIGASLLISGAGRLYRVRDCRDSHRTWCDSVFERPPT